MAPLSQSRFPNLWLFMQRIIGGNASKQRLATEYYCGQGAVLEIDCSVGNISEAFLRFPEIIFTGIDIDEKALAVAQRRFHDLGNFRFSLRSLQELSSAGESFDYVLFAGMLHHVDDTTAECLLRDALSCTTANGTIVIYEPEAVRDKDGWFFRLFYALFEQGAYLRSRDALEALVTRAGVKIHRVEDRMVSPGIVTTPYVARFNLLLGGHAHRKF
jgi:cyclopropane fatty-acyl-phospholipid synthase-like methyltransferase